MAPISAEGPSGQPQENVSTADGSTPEPSPLNGQQSLPSERFLAGLDGYRKVTLLSHIHPDPDSLGSMAGLAYLVERTRRKPTRILRDGYIGRAENRAMVESLQLELLPIEDWSWSKGEAIVMVDSQPFTGRHTLPADVPIYAVLDHHKTPGEVEGIPFVDIRSSLGATCTIVTEYLREQRIEPSAQIATALYYGIESELSGYPREASRADDDAMLLLYPHVDRDQLARIHNARLPQSYFETLLLALQNSFLYDRLIISWAGDLPQPELAAEIADTLIRFEEVDWAFCAGVYLNQFVMSLRSVDPRTQSGLVLQRVVGHLGRAGGHNRRAGGCITLTSTSTSALEQIQATIRRRLLRALRIEECRGQRLVSRRELLQALQD
jgi:nanoRNase/pAp phosphatase (c-di-AMP/oligoRNAs hydrolase)